MRCVFTDEQLLTLLHDDVPFGDLTTELLLTPDKLTKGLNATKIHQADLNDNLWDEIQRHIDAGHLVLCMGAGSIDGWVRQQLASN